MGPGQSADTARISAPHLPNESFACLACRNQPRLRTGLVWRTHSGTVGMRSFSCAGGANRLQLNIAPEDRKLFFVFGGLLVAILLLVAYVIHTDNGTGVAPTSYATGNTGGKAAFMLLEQTGYKPQRWNDDPSKLDALPPH